MTQPARYRDLVARHTAGKVADALLAKWLTDPDHDDGWYRLARDINHGRVVRDYNRRH